MPIKKLRIAGFKTAGYMEDSEIDWEWFPSSKEFLLAAGGRPLDGLPSQVREILFREGMSGSSHMGVRSWTSERYPSGADYEVDVEINGHIRPSVFSSLEAAGLGSIALKSETELTLDFSVEGEFGVSEEEFDPGAMDYDPAEEETMIWPNS